VSSSSSNISSHPHMPNFFFSRSLKVGFSYITVSCGSISQTSSTAEEKYPIRNMALVVGKRLTIRGFIVYDEEFGPKYEEEHQRNMQKWIKNGELAVKLSVTEGIDNAAEGLVGMLRGDNFGKAVLKIADI